MPLEYAAFVKKEPPEVTIGRNIIALRESRGWSQQKLADAAHVDQKTVSNLEAPAKGREAPSPTVSTLQQVSDALGIRLWQLLCPNNWCLAGNADLLEALNERLAAVNEPTRIYIQSVLDRESSH